MTGDRILITTDAVGGVWRYALDLSRGLLATGSEVILAGLGPRPTEEARREAERIGPVEWGDAPLDWMAQEVHELDGVGEWLADLAQHHRVTHLHLNLPSQAVGLPARVAHLPVVAVSHSCLATWFATVRGSDVPQDLAWQREISACGLAMADVVVAPSRSHAEAMRRCYGNDVPVAVVPNAAPMPELQPGMRDDAIVAAGRWWDDGKNPGVLDKVAPALPWPVLLIGSTEGPNGARANIAAADAVGPLPHEETRRQISHAGIFVSPSLYEPFGLAVLEAAQTATPLVLADIPTFRELWDDAAVFFPPADEEALREGLVALIEDPDRRRRIGEAARERAAFYTPRRQVAGMRNIYRRASARKWMKHAAE